MVSFFNLPSPIHSIKSALLTKKEIDLFVKRDDLIHPEISGNKWRKLKYNVQEAKKREQTTLLTFGGAYSNHIAATAAAGNYFGLKTIGVIRGNEGFENKTLLEAETNGMQLHFVSREEYRRQTDLDFISQLEVQYGDFYMIPEGGANEFGVKGCEEMLQEVDEVFDYIGCSAGTATTASGLCRSLKGERLLVFPALKGGGFIEDEMKKFCSNEQLAKVELHLDYHFGGYGKTKVAQIDFMNQFQLDFDIELDKVYTSKMFYGMFDLISRDYFPKGSRILAIHTGGLQGN